MFLALVLPHVPESEVREGATRARSLPEGASLRLAASAAGTGNRVTAQDTVPSCLWCAEHRLDDYDDYEEALWLTVGGPGDRDTTCAIVGRIVAARTGVEGIPRSG